MKALYARVSTSDKGQDTEVQLHDLRAYATMKGWTDTVEYIDEGWSGAKTSRPALNQLMDDCRAGKISHLIIWRLDRFSRSLKHFVNTIEDLERHGVVLVSLKENIDLGTPGGRLLVHILMAFAEFERSVIRERVKAGMANAKRRGIKLGKAPKPFDIEKARQLKAQGQPLRAIAHACGVGVMTVKRRV